MVTEKEIDLINELLQDPSLADEFKLLRMLKATGMGDKAAIGAFVGAVMVDTSQAPIVVGKLYSLRGPSNVNIKTKTAVNGIITKTSMTPAQILWVLGRSTGSKKATDKEKESVVRNALGKPEASLSAELKKGFKIAEDGAGKQYKKLIYKSDTPLGTQIPFAIYCILEADPNTRTASKGRMPPADGLKTCYFPISDPHEKNSFQSNPVEARARVLSDYNSFPTDLSKVSNPFAPIETLLPSLRKILGIHDRDFSPKDFITHKLEIGFPLILAIYHEKCGSTLKNTPAFLTTLNVIVRLMWPAKLVPAGLNEAARSAGVMSWIPLLTPNLMIDDGSFVTEDTFFDRVAILKESFLLAQKYLGKVFTGHTFDLAEVIDFEAKNFAGEKLNADEFNLSDHHPALPLDTVKVLLESAFKLHPMLYHNVLLQLSTCLRNEEMERLTGAYLQHDGTLDYSEIPAGGLEQLPQKTANKRNNSGHHFINPTTSIVTRIILRLLPFCADGTSPEAFADYKKAEKGFWVKGSVFRKLLTEASVKAMRGADSTRALGEKESLRAERTHQRSLRTTGATMLRYGLTTRVCLPIEPKVIGERMAHIDGMMVETVYAKNSPPGSNMCITPDDYITVDGLEIEDANGKVVKVVSNEYLWDAWLLEDLYNRYAGKATGKIIAKGIFDELTRTTEGRHVPKPKRVKL